MVRERLWFKIGDTATQLGVSPKELRYWESVIPELKPRRSKGNLRYYHRDEFPRLERIRDWLKQGLTVADCRELMLHGQLSRGLGLGLEEETPAPPLPTKPARGRKSAPTPAPPTEVAGPLPGERLRPVTKAIKSLIQRLSKPLGRPPAPKPMLDLDL